MPQPQFSLDFFKSAITSLLPEIKSECSLGPVTLQYSLFWVEANLLHVALITFSLPGPANLLTCLLFCVLPLGSCSVSDLMLLLLGPFL
jgi:hypothetical protein